MYKVLIVDDEIMVRRYLRSIISWTELGFELIDDAMDGKDALDKIELYDPDIVILDLTMPVMSGIELLNNFSLRNMRCKVIVLSCHDDYDNVINAMKNGAVDFLLKHRMKEADLINVLNKVVARLEKENSELREMTLLKKSAGISKHVIRKNFLDDMIKGQLSKPEDIGIYFGELIPGFSFKSTVTCAIGVDNLKGLRATLRQSLSDKVITPLQSYLYKVENERKTFVCAGDDNGSYYVIGCYEPKMSYLEVNKDVYDILSGIMAYAKDELRISVTVGVSDICQEVSRIPEFINHAQYAFDCSFYKGKGRIIHYADMQKCDHKPLKSLKEYEKLLYDAIISKPENILDVLNTIYSEIERENASLDFVKDFNVDIISLIKKLLNEFSINSEEVYGNNCFPYKYVNTFETINELKVWLSEIIKRIAEIISQRNEKNKQKEIIKKAIRYIEENYINDITLDDMAGYVNLSKAYFSSFFKKETNENLIEYINRFRIEKARELLENTSLKVYNIALEVGIDNYRYFTKKFKEITGLTPVEYKNLKKSN